MSAEQSFENTKDYCEKNLDAVKIINDGILDIINGQGCLIKPETTILFGPDDKGNRVKIKDFEKPYKVTSHGYMYCAEIVGTLSNGQKFYIHAMESFIMAKILQSIMEEAQNESANDMQLKVIDVKIKLDQYTDPGDVVESKNKDYKKRIQFFGAKPENIELINESFAGFTPEKVVGYDTEEDRENI